MAVLRAGGLDALHGWLNREFLNGRRRRSLTERIHVVVRIKKSRRCVHGLRMRRYIFHHHVRRVWADEIPQTSVSPPPLHRTSPLALYVRRSRMAFFKLSFDEAVRWISQWEQWCEGHWSDSKDVSYSLSAARAYVPIVRARLELMRVGRYGKARTVQDYQAARDATSFYDADDGLST